MSSLDHTNKLLHELERKLSGALTLTQTLHLLVVVDPAAAGAARQNIQSTVLQYIMSAEFNLDAIYADRQEKFITTLAHDYAPEREQVEIDIDDTDDYYDEYYDMPSPPREPPREMDPDKLYGLYDFAGPDPLHCSVARDEPVYLVNDEDNYWWLVRKLSTAERRRRGDALSLDDGKVGFVPAECLETYAERLARLNCFRNEELERGPAAAAAAPKRGTKLVTFETLLRLDLDSEPEPVPPPQVSHEDIQGVPRDTEETHLEVLLDVYPAGIPLIVKKGKKSTDVIDQYSGWQPESLEDSGGEHEVKSQGEDEPADKTADMFMPILGKLDELTEKLAELEHML